MQHRHARAYAHIHPPHTRLVLQNPPLKRDRPLPQDGVAHLRAEPEEASGKAIVPRVEPSSLFCASSFGWQRAHQAFLRKLLQSAETWKSWHHVARARSRVVASTPALLGPSLRSIFPIAPAGWPIGRARLYLLMPARTLCKKAAAAIKACRHSDEWLATLQAA